MFSGSAGKIPIRPFAGLLLGCVLGCLSGCGGKTEKPPLVEVQGKIQWQQNPRADVMVTFTSQGTERQERYYSKTAVKSGEVFTLECPAGTYKATIAPVAGHGTASRTGATTPAGKVSTLPSKYMNAAESPWTEEVPEGGKKDVLLRVQ